MPLPRRVWVEIYGQDGTLLASVESEIDGAFFALNIMGVAMTAYALLQYFVRAREQALSDLARALGARA